MRELPFGSKAWYNSNMASQTVSERMLEPLTECFSPEVARRIVDAQVDAGTQARIDELATKANRGTISEAEQSEYAEFVEYIDLLAIIKAKSRLLLKKHPS